MEGRRMIHTKIWHSKQVFSLSNLAKLLYIGLITIADDEGRFTLEPALLRASIFPREKIRDKRMIVLLKEIEAVKLIEVYMANSEAYGFHPNWKRYQTLRADRRKSSTIPAPPLTNRQPADNHLVTQEKKSEDNFNINEDTTKESKEMGVLKTPEESNPRRLMNDGLVSFRDASKGAYGNKFIPQ